MGSELLLFGQKPQKERQKKERINKIGNIIGPVEMIQKEDINKDDSLSFC